ncbi:MAG: CAF17-like 4Fe-4S cluster assembly/insertion protein YgfZ [Planctomycetaceae bacterium]
MELAYVDRTSRGRLIVGGRDRRDLLHRLATNDVLGLVAGQGRSCCFCTPKGRMIDWTVLLDRGTDLLLLSGNPERLSGHIQQYTISEDLTVRSYIAVELVVCGPAARAFLGVELEPYCHTTKRLGEVEVLIARIEPLLGDAYAVLAPDAVLLRQTLASQGRLLSPEQERLARIRAGIPAFPEEVNEDHNPWEAGLHAAVSLTKGCYIGQEVIARLRTYDKVQKRLVGLRLDAPREAGSPLLVEGREVGRITSSVGALAMGYVQVESSAPGTRLAGAVVAAFPLD